jgi:CrcB protein
MSYYFYIALGGAAGSVARAALDQAIRRWWPSLVSSFPLGILLVNFIGCLLFGLICGSAGGLSWITPERRGLWMTGFLGGLTTFSTFSHDTVSLMREGQTLTAGLNVVLSVVGGLGALWLGQIVGSRWLAAA